MSEPQCIAGHFIKINADGDTQCNVTDWNIIHILSYTPLLNPSTKNAILKRKKKKKKRIVA